MRIVLALYLAISTGYLFYELVDLHNIISGNIWKFIGFTFLNLLVTTVMRDVIQGTHTKGGK